MHIELEFLYIHTRVYDHSLKLQSSASQDVINLDFNTPMKEWEFSKIEGAKAYIWPSVFTLVPNSLYDVSSKDDYIKLSHGDLEQLIIKDEKVSVIDSTLVYGIHPSQQLAALTLYPGVAMHCAIGKLLDYSLHKLNEGMCIKLLDKQMYVCCVKDKKLQLCNSYSISSETDILYFISLINQKHFNAPVDIEIIGYSSKSLKGLLAKYHSKINYYKGDILFNDNMRVV